MPVSATIEQKPATPAQGKTEAEGEKLIITLGGLDRMLETMVTPPEGHSTTTLVVTNLVTAVVAGTAGYALAGGFSSTPKVG